MTFISKDSYSHNILYYMLLFQSSIRRRRPYGWTGKRSQKLFFEAKESRFGMPCHMFDFADANDNRGNDFKIDEEINIIFWKYFYEFDEVPIDISTHSIARERSLQMTSRKSTAVLLLNLALICNILFSMKQLSSFWVLLLTSGFDDL